MILLLLKTRRYWDIIRPRIKLSGLIFQAPFGGVTETLITVKDEDGAEFDQSDIKELRFYGENIGVTTGGVGIASIRVTLPTGIVTAGALSTSSVGFASTTTDLAAGAAGSIPYQDAPNSTTFLSAPGSSNQVLLYDDGSNAPQWSKVGLGTNTVGDYVKSVASGNTQQISISGIQERVLMYKYQ